jgi:hypothetical protein
VVLRPRDLVIVDDPDVVGIAILPAETDPPLLIDPNAMLSRSAPLEFLESITGRDAEVLKLLGGVDEDELAEHRAMELSREAPDRLAVKQAFRVPVREALDHPE